MQLLLCSSAYSTCCHALLQGSTWSAPTFEQVVWGKFACMDSGRQ